MAYILGNRTCEFKKNPRLRFRFITFFVNKGQKNRLLAIFGKISGNSKNERWLVRDLVKIHLCAKFEPSNPNTLAAMTPKDIPHVRFYTMLSSLISDLRWLMHRLHCATRNEADGVLGCAHALRAWKAHPSARLDQKLPPLYSNLFPRYPQVTFPNTPSVWNHQSTHIAFSCIYSPQNHFAVATYRPIASIDSIPPTSC